MSEATLFKSAAQPTTMKVTVFSSRRNSMRMEASNCLQRAFAPKLSGTAAGTSACDSTAASCTRGFRFDVRATRSVKLKRQAAKAKISAPTASHNSRFQSSIPENPMPWLFLSATVQYLVNNLKASSPNGSIMAASFWFWRLLLRAPAIPFATSSNRPPRNEITVLRVSTAMAKMTAAMNKVFGKAKTRMLCQCAAHTMGPKRSASAQGMYLASSEPREMPNKGMVEMTTAPRNLPSRKSSFRIGLVNTI